MQHTLTVLYYFALSYCDPLRHPRNCQRFTPRRRRSSRKAAHMLTERHLVIAQLRTSTCPGRFSRFAALDVGTVAEPRRALVRTAHRPAAATQGLRQRQDTDRRDRCGPPTGTTTPSPSSGTSPPPTSSPRSSADDAPPLTATSNQRRTTSTDDHHRTLGVMQTLLAHRAHD